MSYVTPVELGPPATIVGLWMSSLRQAPTAPSLNIGATLGADGTVVVRRYLDLQGLVPAGPAVLGNFAAAAPGNLSILDGVVYQSYTVTITGSGPLSGFMVAEGALQ